MNEPTRIPGAKLVCVSMASICRCLNAPYTPGFYRIVWELDSLAPAGDPAALQRMATHFLHGKVICAN